MQKTYKSKKFSLTPMVAVLILLALLACYGVYSSFQERNTRDLSGRLLVFGVLVTMIWITSGDYRKYPDIEMDDEKICVVPGSDVYWRDISAIVFNIFGMNPVVQMRKGKHKFDLPLEGYHNKFELMSDISRCCGHLSWVPPTKLEYYRQKYLGVFAGLAIIVTLFLLIGVVVGLCTYEYHLNHVMILSAIVFACGAVIARVGVSWERQDGGSMIRLEYVPFSFGVLMMAGAIAYAYYNNSSMLILGLGSAGAVLWGIKFFYRRKYK